MRTGRFRFVERRRFWLPPIQVLEVEVRYPADVWASSYIRAWIPASGSDAHAIQAATRGEIRGNA
ncbi:hypothetical protein [Methylobacterium oryzae]|uniref:hypothetical protein n=1 Tax=Methylobacterium oryzae TaxID=334852 RepID=UPI001F33B3C7|nr:hypothetical protein [Methylobacterium oryzae]UIN38311.1 hypothetical protein LXM90_31240 [Methylobacterium oryzae]